MDILLIVAILAFIISFIIMLLSIYFEHHLTQIVVVFFGEVLTFVSSILGLKYLNSGKKKDKQEEEKKDT